MKHTLLCSLLVVGSLIAEDEKPPQTGKNFTLHISTKSSSSSNSSNAYDGQPLTYIAVPIHRSRASQPRNLNVPTQDSLPADFYEQHTMQAPVYMVTPQETSRSLIPSFGHLSTCAKNTFCSINPITIAAGALLSLYVVYQIKMYNLSQYALKRNTWSSWKDHIPFEIMVDVPHEEVAEELYAAIKSKYPPIHGTDMMTPMVKFNNAVDHELNKLYKFLQLHEWFSYTKLSYIFPSYEKIYQSVCQ